MQPHGLAHMVCKFMAKTLALFIFSSSGCAFADFGSDANLPVRSPFFPNLVYIEGFLAAFFQGWGPPPWNRPASGYQFPQHWDTNDPKRKIPNRRSQTTDPKPKIPKESIQTKDCEPKNPNERSQTNDPKPTVPCADLNTLRSRYVLKGNK